MCPVCLATAALIVGGATGTGGFTALLATTIFRKSRNTKSPPVIENKEDHHGHQSDTGAASKNGLARPVD